MGGLNKLTMTFSFFHGPGGALGGGGGGAACVSESQTTSGLKGRESVRPWEIRLSGSSFVLSVQRHSHRQY